MRTRIRGGTIVTASDTFQGDLLIDGEHIEALGTSFEHVPVDRTLDATSKLVLPGGVDVHTHLDMPTGTGLKSSDDFESGTIAAACGGTTTIVDFATQEDAGALRGALDLWHAKASGKAVIDYGFHMIVRHWNDAVEREMSWLVEAGVTSFKLFMAYPGVLYLDDGAIFRALQRSREIGALVCLHAENGLVIDALVKQALKKGHTEPRYHALTRPARAEAEATHRAICLAEMADVPVYLVHLSAHEALQEVTRARDRGVEVYAETCPQYLFLTDEAYDREGLEGAKFVMSPPLRSGASVEHLWRGLRRGDLRTIATDHCPFCFTDKQARGAVDFSQIPNGAPGIETRLALTFDGGVRTGKLSLNRWVDLIATEPAKLFGLYPRKGTLAPGSDADIVLFDPEARVTLRAQDLHMNVDHNPYEGREITGQVETVLSRGDVIVEKGTFCGRHGRGSFLSRRSRNEDLHTT